MKDNVVPMPSANVLVRGTLRGMGRRVSCDLLLRRQPIPQSNRYEYTQWTILRAPRELPDGDYVVTTEDGFSFHANRHNGAWVHKAGSSRESA